MNKFKCIGSDCPDTCCSGWEVPVDAKQYFSLQQAYQPEPIFDVPFEDLVSLNRRADRDVESHALIKTTENTNCIFLDDNRLCRIQARYGEAFLPRTCDKYPRLLNEGGNRYELAGYMSCPEVARLVLTDPDSLELDPCESTELDRGMYRFLGDDINERRPYFSLFIPVRSMLLAFLNNRERPFRMKVGLMALMAEALGEYFHPDEEEITQGDLEKKMLAAEGEEAIHGVEMLLAEMPSEGLAYYWIRGFCKITATHERRRLQGLIHTVFEDYGMLLDSSERVIDGDPEVEKFWALVNKRRSKLMGHFGSRVDAMMVMFTRHFIFSHPYPEYPNLLTYTHRLLVELSLARFLLLSHPDLVKVLDHDQADIPGQLFEACAVEIFQLVSRAFEHNSMVWERTRLFMELQKFDSNLKLRFLLHI